jgi:hypothetical protein
MSKYRIITDGDNFIVQKKYIFLWLMHGWRTNETASYDNIMAAKDHVLYHTMIDAKKSGKVKVVE